MVVARAVVVVEVVVAVVIDVVVTGAVSAVREINILISDILILPLSIMYFVKEQYQYQCNIGAI